GPKKNKRADCPFGDPRRSPRLDDRVLLNTSLRRETYPFNRSLPHWTSPELRSVEVCMFPGFFIGTIFLFWLVRALMWGPRYRYRGYGYGQRPWGGPYVQGPSLWGDWDDFDRPARPGYAKTRASPPSAPAAAERAGRAFGRDGLDEAVGAFMRALRDRLRA